MASAYAFGTYTWEYYLDFTGISLRSVAVLSYNKFTRGPTLSRIAHERGSGIKLIEVCFNLASLLFTDHTKNPPVDFVLDVRLLASWLNFYP